MVRAKKRKSGGIFDRSEGNQSAEAMKEGRKAL